MPQRHSAILLINCPDAKGLVASVSGFLYQHGANILSTDEHRDDASGQFFMRIEWDLADFGLGGETFREEFEAAVARRFQMQWRVEYSQRPLRVAVFVSKYLHCFADLLHRHKTGELPGEIALIISNHQDAAAHAGFYGIPFHYVPVQAAEKAGAEARQMALLEEQRIDLVVLARYMQVLSADFARKYRGRIINVHHSFLPAFSGAKPYHAAFERGVKLIGATAHYVTEILDDGPIIEQEVIRVSHRDQLEDLVEKGRDAERLVLSRAVRWHLEHRVLLYGNKTVVFA
jgi:formyltetrahydrofolate deformylase